MEISLINFTGQGNCQLYTKYKKVLKLSYLDKYRKNAEKYIDLFKLFLSG